MSNGQHPNNQSNPDSAIPVYIAASSVGGASSYNAAANTAGHQVKTGPGTFYGLSVNTPGTTSTATIYDGTSTSGTKLGTYSTTVQGAAPAPGPGFEFTTGLFIVLAGGAPADVTIAYA